MSITGRARRAVRRATRNPFAGQRYTLVHCAHHKVGTVWFRKVLRDVADEWGLTFARSDRDEARTADVVFYKHASHFDPNHVPGPFRGTHMIRDPRDVLISAYHYHRTCDEAWVHRPQPRLGGRSLQQHLLAAPEDEGLLEAMRHGAGSVIREMAAWNYEQDEFLELRYEDVIGNELATFDRVFLHYGFTPAAAARAAEIADRHSFRRVTGREVGEVEEGSHLRSGRPGEWRDVFGSEHQALFVELYGDVLQRLGYESGTEWGPRHAAPRTDSQVG